MTAAQKEALKLLSIIDDICTEKGIVYSLGVSQMANYELEHSYEYFNPNGISICLMYEDYEKIISYIDANREKYNIEIYNYKNTDNFECMSSWLVFSDGNLLPPERASDEIYYKTRLIIIPMFYAGNTVKECRRTCDKILNEFKYIECRMPLPHKRIFSAIKPKIARMKQRYYCKIRDKKVKSVDDIITKLKNNTKSDYIVYKNLGNSVMWMPLDEFVVERIQFYGVEANMISNRRQFIERNCPNVFKKEIDKISDLILRGGRDLRRVQLIQLDMMKEIDRICRKYNLKYNLAFGTLLGAIRHGGFIPWDDDADINMPYEDYVKLIEVIDDELDSEKYYFRYQEKEEDCNITYAHLKRNGTIYTKRGRDGFKYHPGVYIDIVPIFNGAPNFILHSIQTRIGWTFRKACWAYMGANSEKKTLKRMYYKALAKIGNKRAYRLFIKTATFFKHKRNKMLFLNGMDRSPYDIGFVKRECFDDPMEIEFEGHKFYAPKDYTGVMDYCYGKDHMKYLPIARRAPKNDALIDLGGIYADI